MRIPFLNLERVVVEVEAFDRGIGRYGIETPLAARPEELQRRVHMELGVIELRNRRRRREIAPAHDHRVVVRRGDGAVTHDVLIQTHTHEPVLTQRVQLARLRDARLQPEQRLGHRHLIDHDLALVQRRFGNTVTCLNDRGVGGLRRGGHTGRAREEPADVDGVGRIVRALIDHLERVARADHGGADLYAARAPAVRQRHFAAAERHLIAGNGHGLEQAAADHALGLLVEKREVVAFCELRGLRRGRCGVWDACRIECGGVAHAASCLSWVAADAASSASLALSASGA